MLDRPDPISWTGAYCGDNALEELDTSCSGTVSSPQLCTASAGTLARLVGRTKGSAEADIKQSLRIPLHSKHAREVPFPALGCA